MPADEDLAARAAIAEARAASLSARITLAEEAASAAEARASAAEARAAELSRSKQARAAAEATARARLAERNLGTMKKMYDGIEAGALALRRKSAEAATEHARQMAKATLLHRGEKETLEHELQQANSKLLRCESTTAVLKAFHDELELFAGPRRAAPYGASDMIVRAGILGMSPEMKHMDRKLSKYMDYHCGGAAGSLFVTARRATSTLNALGGLSAHRPFNIWLTQRLDTAAQNASKSPRASERAFLGKIDAAVGANKLVTVNEAMYEKHVIDVFDDVSIRNIAISLTRRILDGARKRLVRRFFRGHSDDGKGGWLY